MTPLKVTALAGGVGGAKLIDGLAACLSPDELFVIVNTGDDFEHLSLHISPDLDTVCYTLAGLANPATGWGQRDETWTTFEALGRLKGPDWFRLGDKDLATHLMRTMRLRRGDSLSQITKAFCQTWGVKHPILPMSNDPVRTMVITKKGERLGFQEYFVHRRCEPEVQRFEFAGVEAAKPVEGALEAIGSSDCVIFAPSNPWVSIDPILAVPGMREAIARKPVVAVSPIIGGKALKGPAAKMYRELGITPSASAVADHYRDLLAGFVFDEVDAAELENIQRWRIIPLATSTIMKNRSDRVWLAEAVLKFSETILNRSI